MADTLINYPPRIQLAHTPTPLQPLRRLQKQMGGPLIWLKRDDMTGSTLSGNKVRKLEFIAAKALASGCDTLITCGGIQSNHCRATALIAAQLGLKCHLILRGLPESAQASDGNLLLDELSGCSISYYAPAVYASSLDALFAQVSNDYAKSGHKTFAIPTGGSDGDGLWGYIAACDEMRQDFITHNISPAAIITASGSGGTQAGLVVGAKMLGMQADIYGINVCDDEQYFINKIQDDIADWQLKYPSQASLAETALMIRMIDGYVGEGYAKAGRSVIDTIVKLSRTEGVVLDPVYSGKAFDGLLQEIAKGRFADDSDIVFIHTGGVFGLFPYKAMFV
ncbi:MAG: D-cysteine desulfhydrase family protein [Pseudomonadales bacterium]|nr:D-cysteine desulfhydrase family protein [Pseudomonadales bacterium]